ncbi:MAG: Gfo/Idh/MocA family protein, partial [Planctomycetota bacterium]
MATDKRIGIGLIGCGAFGRFCLETFSRMDCLRVAGVADIRRDIADQLGKDFGAAVYYDAIEMIASDEVELVHIATPPSTHYELVMAAVEHGKHCLCEKPLAVSTSEADEMLAAAAKKKLLVPVNFVLRYDAVTDAVKRIIDSGVLGDVLAARLTNCASDTPLSRDHWFWDKNVSGGIFIEHGVHFFDLYRYWLGAGEVISANTETRKGTNQEDRVMCEIRHASGAIASHYHGFDQVIAMDRTDHRLVCEMGDIRVNGWIPLTVRVDAAVDDEGAIRLAKSLGECDVKVIERFEDKRALTVGRGKKRTVTQRISINYTPQPDKQTAYIASVRDL